MPKIELDTKWISLKDLYELNLNGLPKVFKTLQRSVKGWKKRPRKAKGGGYEYHISNLPIEARIDLAQKLKTKIKPTEIKQNLAEKMATTLVQEHHYNKNTVNIHVNLALVKEEILNEVFAITTCGISTRQAIINFLKSYNQGKHKHFDKLGTLGLSTLYNWIQKYKNVGIDALVTNHIKPKKQSILEKKEYSNTITSTLLSKPYLDGTHIYRMFIHKHGKIISYRALINWVNKWKEENKSTFLLFKNPDAYASKYRFAIGKADEHICRLNQEWQVDSTIADIMLNDGKRHALIAIVDVYSRRAILHVARTSSSESILACLLKAFNKWGAPEVIKTDNGRDYASKRVTQSLKAFGIKQEFCPPFTPQAKPFVERFFKTFLHDMLPLLQGYIGHNISVRKGIEAKKAFSARLFQEKENIAINLSVEELQNFCNNWVEDYYENKEHKGLKGLTPATKALQYTGEIHKYNNMSAMALLMAPREGDGFRIVGHEGIRVGGGVYASQYLVPYVGMKVKVLWDEEDWGKCFIFDMKAKFICIAVDINREGFSRQELATAMKTKQTKLNSTIRKIHKEIFKEELQDSKLVTEMLQSRNTEDANEVKKLLEEKYQKANIQTNLAIAEATVATKAMEQEGQIVGLEIDEEQEANEASARFTKAKQLQADIAKGFVISERNKEWLEVYKTSSEYISKLEIEEMFEQSDEIIIGEKDYE